MSINQLLEMSKRSFQTLDTAMKVAGQNTANSETEGYVRQRINLESTSYGSGVRMRPRGGASVGTGLGVKSFQRMRDGFLNRAAWKAQTAVGSSEEKLRLLGSLEGLFPIDEASLGNQMNDFWNAWGDLSDNPTDNGVRLTVRSQGTAIALALNQLDEGLVQLEEEATAALDDAVDQVNKILEDVAALNADIIHARNTGTPDFSAEDRRDLLVKDLSMLVPAQVTEDATGYTIAVEGITVISGGDTSPLTLDTDTTPPTVRFSSTNAAFAPRTSAAGKLGALSDFLANDLGATRTGLDAMAATLVTEVNALHQTGYGSDGETNRDFFDPDNLSAASIRISDAVEADHQAIAASGVPDAAADNTIALAINDLRTAQLMSAGSETIDSFAINITTEVGTKVNQAGFDADSDTNTALYLEGMEKGISGVSVDEEMTRLIQLQQAYSASARVLQTAKEMFDVLLRI